MRKKFVILYIILIFIFVMFTPLIPTLLLINHQPCMIKACDRAIISPYELILNWEETQQTPLLQ